MMVWKKLAKALLFPHCAVAWSLFPAALVMMTVCILCRGTDAPLTILSFVLAFYGLVLLCVRLPELIRRVQRFRRENRYYQLYKSNVQLRIALSLWGTFALNAVYALFQFCLGLWHRSAWFYAMAGYYLLLALMRLTLARHTRHYAAGEDSAAEWRRYRFCGWLLMGMNLALTVFMLYFVYRIRIFRHHEITTIAMAVYTFTALIMAVINVIRYRKYGSPAYSAAKAISLVSATVSMLTLENAMLTTFGQNDHELFRQLMLGVSSIAVMLFVQGISLYMITISSKKLRSGPQSFQQQKAAGKPHSCAARRKEW